MLDAEAFNYGYEITNSVGFKVALHHHSDKPMMQFSSQLILAGEESHLNLKPTLTYTTDNAISSLNPKERNCYAKGEANLTYHSYSFGSLYSFENCIIDY